MRAITSAGCNRAPLRLSTKRGCGWKYLLLLHCHGVTLVKKKLISLTRHVDYGIVLSTSVNNLELFNCRLPLSSDAEERQGSQLGSHLLRRTHLCLHIRIMKAERTCRLSNIKHEKGLLDNWSCWAYRSLHPGEFQLPYNVCPNHRKETKWYLAQGTN